MPDFAAFDPNNLLLGQWSGKFAESGDLSGIALNRIGRGALIDDFNLDGKVDILVINRTQPATLFRNLGADDGAGGVKPRATGRKSVSSSPIPTAMRSERRSRSRSATALSTARSRWAAATRRAIRADPRRARHVGAGRDSRPVAGRRMELPLSRLRQPVRRSRPHQAAGGLLVSGTLDGAVAAASSAGD